jgi:hypothetical protein
MEILDRLLMFLAKIDQDLVRPLLVALTRNIESVPMEGDRSRHNAQFRLILFLLNERVPEDKKQAAAEAVVRDVPPIDVAVRVANALNSDESAVTWGLRRSLNVPKIMKIVQQRFENEFVASGVDVFEESSLPQYVLYQIGTLGPESAKMINLYAMELLEREPKYIGKLIDGFLIEFPGGGPNNFNFEQLKSVYDINRLAALARENQEKAWTSDKEKRAVETFLRLAGEPKADEPPQDLS